MQAREASRNLDFSRVISLARTGYTDDGNKTESEIIELRLRKVGSGVGFILPREMLDRLGVEHRGRLIAIEVPKGFLLAAVDPRVLDQVAKGEAIMDDYQAVLATLAKS